MPNLGGKIVPLGAFDMVDAKWVEGGASNKLGDDCLNLGIANGELLIAANTPISGEFARFTASGLEGRTGDEVAAEIDHDLLIGYFSSEHISHTGVSITGGVGISGGGNILSSRVLDLDINSLSVDGSPDSTADYVVTWDSSTSAHRKVLLNVLPDLIGANAALSNLSSVAINTSLVSDIDSTDDLGTTAKKWRHLYIDITKAALGTAVAPSWCFDIDEGTGIYRWAESIIGFTCDGQYAMRIASGNVVVQNNLTVPDDLLNGLGGAVTVAEAQTAFDHTILTTNPHSTSLANLTDTTIANLLLNQSLMYNGSGWVNSFIPIESTFNGMFLETIDFTVSESAGVVTGSLEKENGGDLTQKFSDGYTILDCTPAKTLVLTSFCGTDSIPKDTKVYILQSAKTTLVASNSGWPTTEHVRIANLLLRSPATTGTDDGALVLRNWNDHLSDSDNMGHIHHVEERLRQEPTQYASGIDLGLKNAAGTVMNTGDSSTKIEVTLTAGVVYQLHKQTYPAFDMYTTASDDIHIANQVANEGGSYQTTIDLVTDITVYNDGSAAGVTISNNRYFSIVIWGVQNRTGQASHVMINIPTGVDTIESSALSDNNNYAVYTMATSFKGTGFLIARLIFKKLAGNEWEYIASSDLRGQAPITASATAIDTTHFLLVDGTRGLQGAWDLGNNALTNVNIDSGTWDGTEISITKGGTGQSTAQAAINALTQVSAATNEYVLTKDTGTGNAVWKEAVGGGGDNDKVAIDSIATAGYLGATGSTGVVRVDSTLAYVDGGDFITISLHSTLKTNYDSAYTHSIDSSQAHSDYLINNGSDTTSGVLTAGAFSTTGDVTADRLMAGGTAAIGAVADTWAVAYIDHVYTTYVTSSSTITGPGVTSGNSPGHTHDDGDVTGGALEDLVNVGTVTGNSYFLVGTAAGVLAWETGATARTSIGLGSGDTVSFQHTTIADNLDVQGYLYNSTGVNLNIGENLLPITSGVYNLGFVGAGPDYLWQHLYLSGSFSDGTNSYTVAQGKTAYDHVSADGSSHGYIDQSVTITSSPTFDGIYFESVNDYFKLVSTELHLKANVKLAFDAPDFLLDVQDSSVAYNGSTFSVEGDITATGGVFISSGNELRLNDVGNSHYVGFEAPALTATQIWVLPATDGAAGYVLSTNGAGVLSWVAP